MRRVLSFGLGLGIGMVVGGNLVRRLDAVQQRFAPDRLGVAAAAWVDRFRAGVVGVVAAATRRSAWRPGGAVIEHPPARRGAGGTPGR
ncbi:MAG: hypothetical protein ACO3VG_03970 [Nitriliruptoraceae bacterium]